MGGDSQSTYGVPSRRAALGEAALFTLTAVDTKDHPGGSECGRPGGSATQLLGCTDTGDDIALATALEPNSNFILYSIEDLANESPYLIFLEMRSAQVKESLIKEEAFIDRGARRVVSLGSRVLVATLESVESIMKSKSLEAAIDDGSWQLSMIWNTGRCGSTLMHKALLAAGVGSFSEPQWLDQLCFGSANLPPMLLKRAFRACWVLDIHLLRALPSFQATKNFSMNPKTCGWLRHVGSTFIEAFPRLRHCFMYRACDKVAESFHGLDLSTVPHEQIEARDKKWKETGNSMLQHAVSDNLRPLLAEGKLPLSSIDNFGVAMRVLVWLSCLEGWRMMQACNKDFASAPVIRMDEFVTKDLAKREVILADVLMQLGVISSKDDARVKVALEVFNENSQKNSAMGGAKSKGLSDQCRSCIHECIRIAAPYVDGLEVEKEGANAILPGSLGTSAEAQGAGYPEEKKARTE